MDPLDIKKRIFAAHSLLSEKTTTKQKFDQIKTLLRGINPKIDKLFENSAKALSNLEKIHQGEIIELTVENLPEDTEEKKKKKKALLFFIQNWKSLHSEVHRVRKEFEKESQTAEQKIKKTGRIVSLAKGPLGLITAVAVVVVVGFSVFGKNNTTRNQNKQISGQKIQVIVVEGKQIPLTELTIGQGPECIDEGAEVQHYHAKDHILVNSLDGSPVNDPGNCGFGKVDEVNVIEIEQ